MRLRKLVRCGALAMIIVGLLAPVPVEADVTAQAGNARIRFVNAAVDVPVLNVYADGTLWAGAVVDTAGYFDITAGEHVITFRLPDQPGDLAQAQVALAPGDRVTVAALNTLADLEALAFVDDVSAPARNSARVKVIHAAPGLDPVRVLVGNQIVDEALAYGTASASQQVTAGIHRLDVLANDGTSIISAPEQVFTGNRAYTVFVIGGERNAPVRLLVAESSVLRPLADSLIRFAHMAQGLGAVTAYINKELAPIYSAIRFGGVTNYLVTGYGTHLVEVYPADVAPGTQPPLASAYAEVGPAQHVVFVAHGTADNLMLTPYVTSMEPLPPNSSRLTVIHAADGNPPLRVTTWEGATVVERVEPGEAVERVIPAGAFSLMVTGADADPDAGVLMQKPGVFLPAGSATLLIIFDNDPGAPLVNAVVIPTDHIPQYASVRWMHAAKDLGAVDVYLNGDLIVDLLRYGEVLPHILIPPGVITVNVYPAGATQNPVISYTLDLSRTDSPRTVVFFGPLDDLRVAIAVDNAALLPPGTARVRFINVATNADTINVIDDNDGTVWVSNVVYGTASVHLNVAAGSYDFMLRNDVEVFRKLFDIQFQPGMAYTVIFAADVLRADGIEPHILVHEP